MKSTLSQIGVLTALLCVSLPVGAQDDEGPTEQELVTKALDTNAAVKERIEALLQAKAKVYLRDRPRNGPLRDAMPQLLRELAKNATTTDYAAMNCAILQTLKPFAPWPDIAAIARPCLKIGVPLQVRVETLLVVRDHGAQGLEKELTAMLSEPLPRRVKERFEITVIEAAAGLTVPEHVRVVSAALDDTKFRTVKLKAARALGEARGPEGRDALLRAADADNRDEHAAGIAALSLLQYGTLDGVGQLVERLQKRRGQSQVLYNAICRAAHREDAGFGEVPPNRYFAVGKPERAKAMEALVAWWEEMKGQTPADVMYSVLREKLRGQGVEVPKRKEAKGTVDALIAGLGLQPLSLRYACVDLLVELTGRDDMFEDFRSILIKLGPDRMKLREWEPTYGFTDPRRVEQLLKEQAQKTEKFKQWWDSVKDRVEWTGSQWKARG